MIATRLTRRFGLRAPIVSAPMALAGSGTLAAAVSQAGGLGLIGGGYGDRDFLERAFADAGNAAVGVGFISWSLAGKPDLLALALDHAPKAVMLSFGDPAPFAPAIRAAGAALICQCQTMAHVEAAVAAGADVVVAQGSEAGGHGAARGGFSFVAETADRLAGDAPDTLLLAAGGIADGRGLAAALMLGADGVLMGSRFWASAEASVPRAFQDAAIAADGDATVRTRVPDVARGLDWPAPFTIRVLDNDLMRQWTGREAALLSDPDERRRVAETYAAAGRDGDPARGGVVVGEAAGLIRDRPSARDLVERIAAGAEALLGAAPGRLAD